MKFWSFEATVAAIYNALGKPKESYNKVQQLGVSAAAGYFAGIFCAVVSHPADTMVSSKSVKHSAPSRSQRSFVGERSEVAVASRRSVAHSESCLSSTCMHGRRRSARMATNVVLTSNFARLQSSTPRSSPVRPSRLSVPSTRRLGSEDYGRASGLVFLWSEPSPPSSGYVVSARSNCEDLDAFAHFRHLAAHLRHVQGHHGSPDHWFGRSGPHQEVSVVLTAMPFLSSSSPSSSSFRRLLESFHPIFSTPMSLFSKSFKPLYTTTKPLFVPYLVFASPSRENVYRTFLLKLVALVCGSAEYTDGLALTGVCI